MPHEFPTPAEIAAAVDAGLAANEAARIAAGATKEEWYEELPSDEPVEYAAPTFACVVWTGR